MALSLATPALTNSRNIESSCENVLHQHVHMIRFQSTPPLVLQLWANEVYQWYPCIESLHIVASVSLPYPSRAAEKRLVVMAPVLLTALYKIVEQPDEVVVLKQHYNKHYIPCVFYNRKLR